MTDYVLTGLVKRRAELAGEIEATHDKLRKLVADLEHLDAAILQFDPPYELQTIRPRAFRPPKDWARRGEMTRIVLDILRQTAEPMTSRDIAFRAADAAGVGPERSSIAGVDVQAGRGGAAVAAREGNCAIRTGARAVRVMGDYEIE